jgi:hypothetical protein
MTIDQDDRVPRQEILPAVPHAVSEAPEIGHLPQGFLGISLFARARYASEQKQFEAYTRLVCAKNVLLQMLTQQRGLMVEYAIQSERARNLGSIRETARLHVQTELEQARSSLENVRIGREMNRFRFEAESERLRYERDYQRKAREALNTIPTKPEPAPKQTVADRLRSVGTEIDDIERAYAELRDGLIAGSGGEENLSDEQRIRLDQFEVLRNNILNDVMAELA